MQKAGFLVITNAIWPYRRHNISILSLPPGGRYHFRYERKYVSAKLQADIFQCPGLLILRNKQTGEMLPLRWCSGVRKEDYGEYLFFDFQFDSIFDFGSLDSNSVWKNYTSQIESMFPADIKNIPGKGLAPLVFPVPPDILKKLANDSSGSGEENRPKDHVRRWLRAVSHLGSLDAYKNENFYTVSRLYQDGASQNEGYECEKLSESRSGYKLVGHRVYFLEVVQVSLPFDGAKAPLEEFRLSSPAGHLQELRTTWAIDGRYDRARFLFYVLPQESSRIPSLLILNKQPSLQKEGKGENGAPDITVAEAPVVPGGVSLPPVPPTLLDLEVVWGAKRYFGKRILPVISLITGLFLFFAADWVASLWPFSGVAKASDYLRYAAIFLIATALNAFSSFVSSFKVTSQTHS